MIECHLFVDRKLLIIRDYPILNHLVKFLVEYNSTNHSQEIYFLTCHALNSHASRFQKIAKMTEITFYLKIPQTPQN